MNASDAFFPLFFFIVVPPRLAGVPLSGVGTLSDKVDQALDRWRAPALLTGLLALVTLVLTMGGLYAVLTMMVGQRSMGVRYHDACAPVVLYPPHRQFTKNPT